MNSDINHPGKWLGMTLLSCLVFLTVMGGVANAVNLTITANNATKAAGQVMVFQGTEFTTSGLLPGDSLTVTLTSAGTPLGAAVGSYPIVPSAAVFTPASAAANYTITYTPGTLTVSPSPASVVLAEYRKPVLMPVSQNNAWTNIVPNALADYFTYVPYTTADAVKLGFPSSCGRLPGDIASTDDCYTISVKKFQQQLALPGIFGGGQGLLDAAGNPIGATVWSHGYGSGGAGWTLPYYDTSKPGVFANTPVTGNAPAPFSDGTLSSAGIWHFPAPTIKGTQGRPIRVQWLNDLPNEKPAGFDPTVCDAAPLDCYPYNRVVTHVHGAHVGPESDGLAHAWYSPNFADKGLFWESTRQHGPEGTYFYPMDQEASTIWYHDHAVGITHNNTNMGMAGFFPITDNNEKRLQGIPNPATKVLPTGNQELGFALQDRIFYDDGQVAMPDAPILDPKHPGILNCVYTTDPVNGDIVPTVPGDCSPLFMKAPDGHLVPYPLINTPNPPPQAYLGTSATLEFFGNIPVVNGVTYGKYNVDKGVYRLRFIGGTDSRTWALRLKVDGTNPPRYLPFWVIGTEQGLLNNAVMSEQLLIMPGERYDVLVDFKSAAVLNDAGVLANQSLNLGGQRVILENWAGDGPYGGEIIEPVNTAAAVAFRSVDIPEVMVFDVSSNSVVGDVPSPTAALALRTTNHKIPTLTATTTRNVSLVEIIDGFDRIMPTIDGRGFMEFPVTELPRLNTTEQWDIINTTVDAHPMHLHQVAFLLINREATASVVPALIIPPYNSASYVGSGVIEPPGAHEAGFKDTVMCPPGKVTRVVATYDIPGAYVWHCHILSHEEHDMMRPMVVTTPATSVSLTTSAISQPTGTVITPVELTAQAFTGVVAYPVGSGFEYEFVVTKGGIPIAEQPIRPDPKFLSSNNDAFNMVRYASWTPPNISGTYTITVNTKAMGVDLPNPVQTASVVYTVSGPSIVNATSTTPNGSYNAGKPVDITLTFNQLISSAAGLTIALSSGASITTGPLSNASSFSGIYTVAAGENALSLNVTSVTGTITDAVGTNAVLNPSVPAGFNISNSRSIAIDTVTPVTSINQIPGTYSGPLTVTMATTPGDTIHYTVTSDVINLITPLTATAVGNASILLNAAVTTTFTVQYYATDAAGNIETGKTAAYTIHVADLTNATVAINNGAQFTNNPVVTLAFTATDPSGISGMQIACDGVTFGASEVFPSLLPRTCTLAGPDGSKTVAVKYIDTVGTVYPPVSSTIILDTVAPVSTASSLNGNYNGAINVALTSEANAQIYYSTNGIAPTVSPTQLYNGQITIPATTTLKYFAVDQAGNQETVQSQTYTIAGTDLIGSVSINNKSPFTNSTAVTLTLAAADPLGVGNYMISDDGINYQTVNIIPATASFNATIPWILPAGDGVKTVYVKYVDTPVPNNVYGPFTAQITLDTVPPVTTATPLTGAYNGGVSVVLASELNAKIYYSTNGIAPTAIPANLYSAPIPVSATTTLMYFAVDQANNQEAVNTQTYTIALPDLSGSVVINNNAQFTTSSNVTLTLSATDPQGVGQYMLSNDNITYQTVVINPSVSTFNASVSWALAPGNGLRTVYVKYVDTPVPNNVYGPFAASITVDNIAPTLSVSTPQAGAIVNTASVTVNGTVTDAGGVNSVTVNGAAVTVAPNGSFVSQVSLVTGANTITVVAADMAGNTTTVTRSVTLDVVAPTLTVTTPINGAVVNTPSLSVSGTATDPSGSGIQSVTINGSPVSVAAVTGAFSSTVTLAAGANIITVVATDVAGNSATVTRTVTLDTVAPVSTATPGTGTYNGGVTVALASEPNTKIYYSANGIAPTAIPANLYSAPIPVSATTTLMYFAVDQANNQEVVNTQAYTIALPDLSGSVVINNNAQFTTSNTVTLALSATDPQGVGQYMLSNDNITYQTVVITPAVSTFNASVSWTLAPGNGLRTVYVKYVDTPIPNNVYGPFAASITVDNIAPTLSVSTPQAGAVVNTPSVTVNGTATDAGGVNSVTVNGAAVTVAPNGSFVTQVTLLAGANTITVVAADMAGNSTTVTRSVTLDSVAPTLIVTTPVNGTFVNTPSISVSGTATDASGIQSVTVNGSPVSVAAVTGAFNSTVTLAAGANIITVVATDAAGNSATVSRTVTLDAVIPVTTINPTPGTYSGPLTVTLATKPGATIHYTVTSDVPNLITPVTASAVSTASIVLNASVTTIFTVQYYATDAAGNIETGKTASYTIHVADLTNATIAINNGAQFTKNPVVTLSFTATDPLGISSMQIACDGFNFGASVVFPPVLPRTCTLAGPDGLKTVAVKFIDTAGTVYPPVSSTIILDTLAPVTTASPQTGNYNGAINVVLTSEANAQIYYTTNGIDPTVTPDQLYNGQITIPATTTLKYFAVDQAGNKETVQSRIYTIASADLIGSVTINNNEPFTNSTAVTLTLAAADPFGVGKYMISDDGINYQTVNITPATTNFNATIPWILSSGDVVKTVYVKYVDTPVPNNVYGPFTAQITLDTVPPVTTATPGTGTYNGGVTVVLASEPNAKIYYSTNGTAPTAIPANLYSGPIPVSVNITLMYFAVDQANNQESVKSQVYTVAMPDLSGAIEINNNAAFTTSYSVVLKLTATDPLGVGQYMLSNDGISYQSVEILPPVPTFSASVPWTLAPGNGPRTVYVKFVDTPNPPNTYGPFAATITVDNIAPTLSVTTPQADALLNTSFVTVNGTVTDAGGVSSLTVNGAVVAIAPNGSFTAQAALVSGTNTITVLATDLAGNSTTVVRNITLDTVVPVTTSTPAAGNYSGVVTVILKSKPGSTIYYTTNGQTPTTASLIYSAPFALSPTVTTTYNVQFFAKDASGNVEAVKSVVYTIHVTDLTNASAVINNGAAFTASRNVTVALAATDPDGVPQMQVACDGVNFGNVENFAAARVCTLTTGDGAKTVAVKFIDGLGVIYSPVTAEIILDTMVPALDITTPVDGLLGNASSIAVSGAATDLNGIQSLKVNGVTVTPGVNGAFSSNVSLVAGLNTITVTAADYAGNTVTAVRSVSYDAVIPATTATPAAGVYSANVTVTLASKPGATIYYSTNGQAPTTSSSSYSGPFVLSAAATTTFNIQYFAKDAAGNVEPVQSVIYTIHVSDLTNASVIINKGNLFTNNPNVALALAATDPSGVTKMQVACDGVTFGAEEAFSVSRNCLLSSGDGVKTIAVKFIDGTGIVYDPVTSQITLDTVVPVTSATPGAGIYGGSINVALTASKNASIYYTIDGAEPTKGSAKYSGPIVLNAAATSTINLKFFAVDQAGNTEATRTLVYTLHTGDLSQAVVSINNGAQFTNSPTVTLALAASDPNGVPQMQVACDGVNFSAPEPFAATRICDLPVGDGLKTVEVKYIDGLGTVYPPVPAQITLDTAAAVTSATPVSGTYSGSVSVTLSANETAKVYFTTDGSEPAAIPADLYTGTFDLNSTVTKQYSVKYFAVDRADNRETTKTMNYTLHVSDLVGSIKIDSGAPYTAGSAVMLTLSAVDPAGVDSMQFSNDGINFSPLETYATTKVWTLNPGDGLKTVYVRFTDGTGTVYTFSTNIILAAAAATVPVGDLNGDGSVDIRDALKAMQISIGLAAATNDELVRGDVAPLVNSKPVPDGKIDIVDVLVILRRSIGLITW